MLEPTDVIRWRRSSRRGGTNRRFASNNPSSSSTLWYSLPKNAESASVKVQDIAGKELAVLRGGTDAGLQAVRWNLTQSSGRGRVQTVPTGSYRITLVVDDKEVVSKILEVKSDPTLAPDAISEQEFEAVEELLRVGEEEEDGLIGDNID